MSPRIPTRFTREYGVEHPIVQAGMAFVGTPPDLAIAVCRAGGVGSIAAGLTPAPALRGLIRALRAATDGLFHVNLITPFVTRAQIEVCVEEEVPIASFHWGHPPEELTHRLRGAGVKIWEQVGSVEAAREAVDAGVDLIVAQGLEAGGHNFATLPTFAFVPAVVDAVAPIPVLAAGGIATGSQLAAALALGADGAWIGTRFVASEEAFAHPLYKQRLVELDDTRLTTIYGPEMAGFQPMRVLDFGLARAYAGREDEAPKDLAAQPVIATMSLGGEEISLRRFTNFPPTPDTTGDIDAMPFLAGQGVGLIREIMPVGRIVEELMTEALVVLAASLPDEI